MIGSFLKNIDVFGHQVVLTLNGGNGSRQTSKLGGFVTLLIYVFVATYMSFKIVKMNEGNLDNQAKTEELIRENQITQANMSSVQPYFQIHVEDPNLLDYFDFHINQIVSLMKFESRKKFRMCTDEELFEFEVSKQEREADENLGVYYYCVDSIADFIIEPEKSLLNSTLVTLSVYYNQKYLDLD